MFFNCVKDTLNYWSRLEVQDFFKIIIKTLKQSAWKMHSSFHNHLLFFWAFLFFKTELVTQVFITDMQVKIWKSLYTFKWIHIEIIFLGSKMSNFNLNTYSLQYVRVLELYTRKVCEMLVNKHSKTIECIKN